MFIRACKATLVGGLWLVLASSCRITDGVDGDGHRQTESRSVGAFSRVSADGPLDVTITQGETPSVVVSVDSNLQPLVRTHVADDRLFIDVSEPIGDIVAGPHVLVTTPLLRSAVLRGSGGLSAETFQQADPLDVALDGSGDMFLSAEVPGMAVRLTGSGNLRLRGVTADATLTLDGSGDLRAVELTSVTADIRLAGSGNITATVTGTSRVALDGSGDVELFGGGTIEHSSRSGSGQLRVH